MIKRRTLLQQATAGLAALPLLAATRGHAAASGTGNTPQAAGCEEISPTERNKRILIDHYEKVQRTSVPPTLPGVKDEPLSYGESTSVFITMYDPPRGVAGWHKQSMGPSLCSYSPMIAEDEFVVEEWESFFYGKDGTMYSNQYCWIKEIKDGAVVNTREYVDSHHVYTVFNPYAEASEGKEPGPLRTPRRRGPARRSANLPALQEMETVFPIRQEFNLPPEMLRDVRPSAKPQQHFPNTHDGNKAVVQAMRDAQAKGDAAAVDRLHGKGFRHYVAGEGPLGWEHIPFKELYAPLVEHLASPLKVRFSRMVAEGNSVFEEMDSFARLDDGTVYNNWHCFIHEIQDGLIVQTREYMDTHHLWVVLGRWADWGKTPVPPLREIRRSNLPSVRATYQRRNIFLKNDRWDPLPPVES